MRSHVSAILPVLLAGALLAAAGCNRRPAGNSDQTHIIATVYAVAAIAKEIGGDRVSVEWWVESGQSLSQFAETPQRRAQFRNADIMITRGALDAWTLEGYGNTYQDRKILRIDTLNSTHDADPAQYLWLDPRCAVEIADELTTRLCTMDPRGEAYFRQNSARFNRDVAAAVGKTTATLNQIGAGAFVSIDPNFLPLARRFGLREVAMPQASLDEPNAYNLKILHQAAADGGAGAIFANGDTPLPLLHEWETRLNLPVVPLDALGTSAPSGRSSYLALLRYNLDQIVVAAERATRSASSQPIDQANNIPTVNSTPERPQGAILPLPPRPADEKEFINPSTQKAPSLNPFELAPPTAIPTVRPSKPEETHSFTLTPTTRKASPSNPFAK